MRHLRINLITAMLILSVILLFLVAPLSLAQTGNGYALTWSTVDDGGGSSSGGSYVLAGTIGQAEVNGTMSGGSFTLVGGFWSGGPSRNGTPYPLYLPIIFRNS